MNNGLRMVGKDNEGKARAVKITDGGGLKIESSNHVEVLYDSAEEFEISAEGNETFLGSTIVSQFKKIRVIFSSTTSNAKPMLRYSYRTDDSHDPELSQYQDIPYNLPDDHGFTYFSEIDNLGSRIRNLRLYNLGDSSLTVRAVQVLGVR